MTVPFTDMLGKYTLVFHHQLQKILTTATVILSVFPPAAILVTLARLYIRFSGGKSGPDDWWAISAMLMVVTWIATAWVALREGGTRPHAFTCTDGSYFM